MDALGQAWRDFRAGRLQQAEEVARGLLLAFPQHAGALHLLGALAQATGRHEAAVSLLQQAVQIAPDDPEAQSALGHLYGQMARLPEAIECFQRALAAAPNHAHAHYGMGLAYQRQENLAAAEASFRKAMELASGVPQPRYYLGMMLLAQGRIAEALACFEELGRLHPHDPAIRSAYLGSLNYSPTISAEELYMEHRRWGESCARPAARHDNDRDAARRLRIGYVSPDFRLNAVAYFMAPILAHHNRQNVESYCYAEVAAPDAMTAHLQQLAHQWRNILGWSNDAFVQMVRRDRIDILVDLAGHFSGPRLLAFAAKPAPVQVSYLGYPATTGMAAMDYRLVDAVTEPPGAAVHHVEELVRLSPIFFSYLPPPHVEAQPAPPVLRNKFITFGSMHKPEKLNPAVIDLWCRLLREVPGARLLLARHVLSGSTAAHFQEQFERGGVDRSRLIFRTADPYCMRHLELYHEIDIALDVFPWNGHTTACEALWMGVPVITLCGDRYAGRMVASLLRCLGFYDWIAKTPEEYCSAAAGLAGDVAGLAELRPALRKRVAESALCGGEAFTRELESAYRWMWQRWLSSG
jgi:protein O-GlcNAc transferase